MSWLHGFALGIYNWKNGIENIKLNLKKEPHPLRIGVISAATINVSAIADPTQTHPDAVITAIAARDKSKAQAQIDKLKLGPDCKAYGSYAALINDREIEAVFIPLPNGLHTEWAIKAMEAGKHVLIEKPITSNAAEAKQIKEAAARTNKVAVEAFHWRFHPAAHHVREIIESGKYGSPKSIYSRVGAPAGAVAKDDIRVKYDLAGGAAMDFIYVFSSCTYFAAPDFTKCSIEVTKAKPTLNPRDPKVDDRMEAEFVVRPPGKPPVYCSVDGDFEIPPLLGFIPRFWLAKPFLRMELEKARLDFDNFILPSYGHTVTITEKDASGTLNGKKTTQSFYDGGPLWGARGEQWWTTYRWQLEAFVGKVRAKQSGSEYSGPWVTLEESEKLMELVDSVYDKAGLPRRGISE